ncbi:DUF1566 domain-containing protein [bacterium]|nr:DUF1566 domain-containing protein [bacterium]
MGMPENQQNGINITPDGVVYRIEEDGTISKIARILPNNEILPLGNARIVREKVVKNSAEAKNDPYNYIDRGSYIELVTPVLGISMIQKEYARKKKKHWWSKSLKFTWNEAVNFAQELRLGGFDDWRIPTKEEVKVLYEISVLCGIRFDKSFQWSSSVQPDNSGLLKHVSLYMGGSIREFLIDNENKVLLRCVR